MHDEHLESVKRRKQLEQRRIIKEQHLEREALEILSKRESIVYMQRSRQIYKQRSADSPSSIRKELFSWSASNLNLYALCDSEWHGRAKCYEMLRKIDKDSPEPPTPKSGQSPADHYHILWCRYLNVNVAEIRLAFRDYTQSLVRIKDLHMFGHVLGAEYEAQERALRDVSVGLGIDGEDGSRCEFRIVRFMSPFKLYHDWCSKMSFMSCAYGPCWEGNIRNFL